MAKCTFENITSEQAIALAQWFDGQGEQQCYDWFYELELKSPMVKAVIMAKNQQDVIVKCK